MTRRALLGLGLFTLVGVALLVGLGFWQIERMGAKQRLIARVTAGLAAPPVPVPPEAEWPRLVPKAFDYLKVTATGRFLHDKEARLNGFISERPGTTVTGAFILTPLQRADGSILIVNRGFVPGERLAPASRAAGQVAGDVTVVGLMRPPEQAGLFLPPNDPQKNVWFTRAPAEIAQAYGLTRVAPFVIDADGTPNPGGLPRGGQTVVSFPDNHLQYALTWFSLALAVALAYLAMWRQARTARPDESGP